MQGFGQHLHIIDTLAGERIERPLHGFDRPEHMAFGMGEGVKAEPAQEVAQLLGLRIAEGQVMDEVAGTFGMFWPDAGKVVGVTVLELYGKVVDFLQQATYLSDVGMFVHAC